MARVSGRAGFWFEGAEPPGVIRRYCQPLVPPELAKFPVQQVTVPCVASKLSNQGILNTSHWVRNATGPDQALTPLLPQLERIQTK